jgi:hypothetical protein
MYGVMYRYYSQKKNRGYSLDVGFCNSEEDNATIRAMYKKHTREFRKLERERRKSFDVHRDPWNEPGDSGKTTGYFPTDSVLVSPFAAPPGTDGSLTAMPDQ